MHRMDMFTRGGGSRSFVRQPGLAQPVDLPVVGVENARIPVMFAVARSESGVSSPSQSSVGVETIRSPSSM